MEVRFQERQEHRENPLVEKEPGTAWNKAAAQEYGFYSNVNPNAPPCWSQATERRIIGEDGLVYKKRKTLMFNGYEAQVGQLYAGMDLEEVLLICALITAPQRPSGTGRLAQGCCTPPSPSYFARRCCPWCIGSGCDYQPAWCQPGRGADPLHG